MRADDVCEECVPVVRAYQVRCNMLTQQLEKAETERDKWRNMYKSHVEQEGFRFAIHVTHILINTTKSQAGGRK